MQQKFSPARLRDVLIASAIAFANAGIGQVRIFASRMSRRLASERRCRDLLAVIAGIAMAAATQTGQARVTQINITTTEAPTFGGTSFGAVGQYERIEGTITGEVNPNNPQNAVIVDLDRAPKNTNGTVGYAATFQILRPIDLNKGNHRVIFELP